MRQTVQMQKAVCKGLHWPNVEGKFQRVMVACSQKAASQMEPVVKNPPANAGELRDASSIPGSGRSPGGGNGTPLQYSCPENPMDRGVWWATVHGVTESDTTKVT